MSILYRLIARFKTPKDVATFKKQYAVEVADPFPPIFSGEGDTWNGSFPDPGILHHFPPILSDHFPPIVSGGGGTSHEPSPDPSKHKPYLIVTPLYEFSPGTVFEQLSPTEQALYNTVLIVPHPSSKIKTLEGLYQELTIRPGVVYVQYDQEYELYAKVPVKVPVEDALTAKNIKEEWWFKNINCIAALEKYSSAIEVKIAVIDEGIDHTHRDLAGFKESVNRQKFAVAESGSRIDTTELPEDYKAELRTHGTHVAGIIAAQLNDNGTVGIAHQATLMDLQAFPDAKESILSVAVKYAIDHGAKVINASWGAKKDPHNLNLGSCLQDAINHACSVGIIVVCAAGNDGGLVMDYVPASFANVITVGSFYIEGDSLKRAETSNYGDKVIWAPGVRIYSLKAGAGKSNVFLKQSGTSMAAAFVSALVARMLQAKPSELPKASNNDTATPMLNSISKRPPIPNKDESLKKEDELLKNHRIDVDSTLQALKLLPRSGD